MIHLNRTCASIIVCLQLLHPYNAFVLRNHCIVDKYANKKYSTRTIQNVRAKNNDGIGEKHAEVAAKSIKEARNSSFEDAQVIGQNLAKILSESCKNDEPMPEEAKDLLRALISTTSGARGWFVTLLTNPEFEPIFVPPVDESLLTALCDNPKPNVELMTMNVAMPTATELIHLSNGNVEMAKASQMTARRSILLAEQLLDRLPGLRGSFEGLLSAVDDSNGDDNDQDWVSFVQKWGYEAEQKEAIRKVIVSLLKL